MGSSPGPQPEGSQGHLKYGHQSPGLWLWYSHQLGEGGRASSERVERLQPSTPAPGPERAGWVLPSAHAQLLGGGSGGVGVTSASLQLQHPGEGLFGAGVDEVRARSGVEGFPVPAAKGGELVYRHEALISLPPVGGIVSLVPSHWCRGHAPRVKRETEAQERICPIQAPQAP